MNNSDSNNALRFRGLTAEEVLASRAAHGENLMLPPVHDPWWRQLLGKFDDPIIRILIIAALIAIATAELIEGIGILVAVLLATLLAFINEFRAEKEFDLLNKVNDDIPVKTIRDGQFCFVPRRELVVGDVIFVERGEEFPADGQVLDAISLQVDQSKLTGESDPVVKAAPGSPGFSDIEEGTYPADRVFRGSLVADGHAYITITAVGPATEIGKTAAAGMEDIHEETPLSRQLEGLGRLIGVVGFGVAGITFFALLIHSILIRSITQTPSQWLIFALVLAAAFLATVRIWLPILCDGLSFLFRRTIEPAWLQTNTVKGWLQALAAAALLLVAGLLVLHYCGRLPADFKHWLDPAATPHFLSYFMIAVTLIVVAVPEGLAMSVTLSLAYSMRRMTAANNLVRKMHACETIGAATVICTDKTGTLTMNQMRVQKVSFPALPEIDLSSPVGALIAEAIAANSTANLSRAVSDCPEPLGNPTEGALLLWLDRQGIPYERCREKFAVSAQLTFSTERKFMATAGHSAAAGSHLVYIKGAPEVVMDRCSIYADTSGARPLTAADREQLFNAMKQDQMRGMRTIALAYGVISENADQDLAATAVNLTWLGFTAIADPVRPDVPDAVATCRRAGIDVKMVTGDNPETAMEIGRQIGLWLDDDTEGRIITGKAFAELDDATAFQTARRLRIMARARPTDKLRLVKLLKQDRQVVAVTGDGTNDAPALNNADVGIAMGRTGTSVAKEASAIILLDDSFKSIVNAVMWGRSLYQNIQKFLLFQLTINVTALGIAVLGPFIGVEMPLTVMQMLWVNLIMDTFAALSLATEPPQPEVMNRPPRSSTAFIITPAMARNILSTGIFFLIGFITVLKIMEYTGESAAADGPHGLSPRELTLFFCAFTLAQVWNLFNAKCWGSNQSFFRRWLDNRAFLGIVLTIVVGQIMIVQFGGKLFRTIPLDVKDWAGLIAATSVVFWAGELIRLIRRKN